MVRARSEATKAATLPTSASVAARSSKVACSIPAVISSRSGEAVGQGLGHTARFQGDDADAVRAELACPLAAQTLDGVEGDLEAAQPGQGLRPAAAERQDHPRPAPDHVPGGRPGRQELRPHRGRDRLRKSSTEISVNGCWTSPYEMRLNEISIAPACSTTASTYASTARSSRASTTAVSATPPCARIVVGDRVELRPGATGEEDPGPLAGKGTRHRTADRAARAVDHGNLVLQQHRQPSFLRQQVPRCHRGSQRCRTNPTENRQVLTNRDALRRASPTTGRRRLAAGRVFAGGRGDYADRPSVSVPCAATLSEDALVRTWARGRIEGRAGSWGGPILSSWLLGLGRDVPSLASPRWWRKVSALTRIRMETTIKRVEHDAGGADFDGEARPTSCAEGRTAMLPLMKRATINSSRR